MVSVRTPGTRGSTQLLLALLPALLVLPALGGIAVWWHAHGAAGAHAHGLESAGSVLDARAHHARHLHEDGARPGASEQLEPTPAGGVVALPRIDASVVRVPTLPASLDRAADPAAFQVRSGTDALALRSADGRGAGPTRRARRSGLAELLRSNHAILI